MISKIGKYLREIKSKPKREKVFKQISQKIRDLSISFTPLLQNELFYDIWSQLLEFGAEQKERDIEDGTYQKELEVIYDEPE